MYDKQYTILACASPILEFVSGHHAVLVVNSSIDFHALQVRYMQDLYVTAVVLCYPYTIARRK